MPCRDKIDTYVVIHVSGAQKENAVIVRELGLVDIGAIVFNVATVVDVVISGH